MTLMGSSVGLCGEPTLASCSGVLVVIIRTEAVRVSQAVLGRTSGPHGGLAGDLIGLLVGFLHCSLVVLSGVGTDLTARSLRAPAWGRKEQLGGSE